MNLRLVCYIQMQDSGKIKPLFFNTEEEAKEFAKPDGNDRFYGDIQDVSLPVDHNGKLTEIPTR